MNVKRFTARNSREALRLVREALDDRAHVADVHAFLEQQLQHLLQRGDAHHLRHHILDQLGCQLRHMLHQLLRLHTAEQLGGMDLHQV